MEFWRGTGLLWRSLLLLRHCSWPAAYSALQCDEASCQLLGRSAIARGIPLRLCSRLPDLRSRYKLQSGSHRHAEDLRHPAEDLQRVDDFLIEVCTAIEDQVAGSRVVRECLAQLLNDPGAGRMPRHIE